MSATSAIKIGDQILQEIENLGLRRAIDIDAAEVDGVI